MAQNQSGYTDSQIRSMQQDAMRRVNEMQRVARQRVHQNSASSPPPNSPKPQMPIGTAPEKPIVQAEQNPMNGLTGFLDRLGLDDEKILLILLLFLLINEGADTYLIMALVYILI